MLIMIVLSKGLGMRNENIWLNKRNGWMSLMMMFLLGISSKLCNNSAQATNYYSPPYNPTIRYLPADLKNFIVRYTKDYYNEEWKISLSQYMAWIASIPGMEASNLRYAAHSGSAIGKETFYHITVGEKFPFSTSIGAFQLGYGGSNAENWGIMPTIDKLNPEKSLFSVLRWHKNKFGPGTTLADFQKKSAWYAVKTEVFENNWQLITDKSWDECKNIKMEVAFHPPITNASPYREVVKHIGKVYWSLPGWQNYFDTWLISAKTYQIGKGLYSYSYYYTKNEKTHQEVWVWNADSLFHGYTRRYASSHLPDNIKGEYAGFTSEKPVLDPNNFSLN